MVVQVFALMDDATEKADRRCLVDDPSENEVRRGIEKWVWRVIRAWSWP